MRRIKNCTSAVIAAICAILIAALGCNKVASQPQKSALKFSPTDQITYKVTTDRENGVVWQGPPENKPKKFIGGHSGNKIEMTFTQQIENVNAQGGAIVKITIKQIKYLSKIRDKIVLDFDSSLEQDKDNPLSKLIGQSYTIELNASGEVSKIIDVNDARAAVAGNSISNARATQLLSLEAITEQHSAPSPLAVNNKQLIKGNKWNNIKTFSFGQMGSKSFERIYEIINISEIDGRQIAIAQMNAEPSTAKAKELYKEQSTGLLSSMFDNTETYTGVLSFDLDSGQIEKYNEEFKSVWTAVDPLATKQENEPDRFQMSATRIYRLERID
jgi:predicted transposase YbfD/YdcC